MSKYGGQMSLAVTTSKPVLLVGTLSDVVFGLDPITLNVRWVSRLGYLYGPTLVFGGDALGDGSGFAGGDDGFIYRLSERDGRVLGRVYLTDVVGYDNESLDEILSASGDVRDCRVSGCEGGEKGLGIYRGYTGPGMGLRIVYATSLPGSGYSFTDVERLKSLLLVYQVNQSITNEAQEHAARGCRQSLPPAPLFTIQRHGAWGTGKDDQPKPMIILYQGADTNGPIAGTITKDKDGGLLTHDTIIELRPASELAGKTIRERLESDVSISLKNSRFRFSFDIAAENEGGETQTRRETFEWRISKAIEVRSLDSTAFGWKLVRLAVAPSSSTTDTDKDKPVSSRGGPRESREAGETSDGKEVVAAWSENSGMTLSKVAKFHFLGRGATGKFGDDWALMVALSAFPLWKFTSGSISVRP
ncbi:hypothetical protein V8F20_009020 [Naviculisporaceae sp. PSN 640]